MTESVTSRSKYLEIPQEVRNRIVKIYSMSLDHRKKAKELAVPLAEEIYYKGVSQELGMISISTDEVKYNIQEKLSHLEEIRDYVKEVTAPEKEQRKAYLSGIIKKELSMAEDQLAVLEEKMRSLIGKSKENVLVSLQSTINRLSRNLEQL
ncbi:uncharacterized protein NEMAJ01_0809 [Nematocida major]|uniref:uncharacterized protein n=1 Tax=Nematocida major TaxID=1912982 RepID=UPI0020083656|nr:uncharacterized protein NEMAJ01_0809 [Nematocida major]KAH9385913.1 hypothetical protein NEMAJ01_0809 [Nematocida major]